MKLTYSMRRALAIRRLYRSLAVAIYPPFEKLGGATFDEFQRGLEAGIQAEQWQQEIRTWREHVEDVFIPAEEEQ